MKTKCAAASGVLYHIKYSYTMLIFKHYVFLVVEIIQLSFMFYQCQELKYKAVCGSKSKTKPPKFDQRIGSSGKNHYTATLYNDVKLRKCVSFYQPLIKLSQIIKLPVLVFFDNIVLWV